MLENAKSAISLLNFEVGLIRKKIDSDQNFEKYRGCPTLLVNRRDYEEKVKYEKCKPFCREYRNGIPTVEEIKILFCIIIDNY